MLVARHNLSGGCHGGDRMVVGCTTTYEISVYQLEPSSWQGVLDTTLCNKVCQ